MVFCILLLLQLGTCLAASIVWFYNDLGPEIMGEADWVMFERDRYSPFDSIDTKRG